jgi:alpha-ribazole phosphatase
LFPGRGYAQDDRLWEQDFGEDDGRAFDDLPDLGPLSLDALAQHASHGGESFLDMVGRVEPTLREIAKHLRAVGPTLVVAHAGTARAGLGLALEHPALGLKFEVAPLSLTRLRCLDDGFSIIATNQSLPL